MRDMQKKREAARIRWRAKNKKMREQLKGFYNKVPKRDPNAISDEELIRRLELVPHDTRDLTGRIFGDPIPNDKRRPWLCRNMETVNSAESTH